LGIAAYQSSGWVSSERAMISFWISVVPS
jgi:hypothetical protein